MPSMTQQKQTQTSSSKTAPWSVQQPYLKDAFKQAQGAFNEAQGATTPNDFVAQFTPEQLDVFQRMVNAGLGSAAETGQAGADLTGAGSAGVEGALNRLGAFTPMGGTQSNIDAANQYASEQNVGALTDAAMRDATRYASEQTLPAIAREAAATGNTNSSKRAIAEGIVQRGLAEQAGDISAKLRGDIYSHGLDLAEQNSQAQNQAILAAIMGQGNLGNDAVSSGSNAVAQQGGLFDLALKGVSGQNTAAQDAIKDQLARYAFQTTSPFDALNQYYAIIGDKNWGGSASGKQVNTTQPSTLDTVGKIVGSLANVASVFV